MPAPTLEELAERCYLLGVLESHSEPALVAIREAWELSSLLSFCSLFLHKKILVLPFFLMAWLSRGPSLPWVLAGRCAEKPCPGYISTGGQHHPSPLSMCIGGFKKSTTRQLNGLLLHSNDFMSLLLPSLTSRAAPGYLLHVQSRGG